MLTIRPGARIVLINPENKVLLMHLNKPTAFGPNNPQETPYWILPGGGIEGDETPEEAARRELFEETGITDAIFVLPHMFYEEIELMHKGEPTMFKEWFFVARTQKSAISTDNYTEQEKLLIDKVQWWSLPELRETTEIFFPSNLVDLIDQAVSNTRAIKD